MMTAKNYTINGAVYIQRPLVLGQIRQLTAAMDGVEIPAGANIGEVAAILADRLPHCAAAVLQPEGIAHKDKDLVGMAAEFAEHLDLATVDEVIEDFFTVTPVTVLARLMGRLQGTLGVMRLGMMATGLTKTSVSSPGETSPNGTASSGGTL